MTDTGNRKPPVNQAFHPLPGQMVLLTATLQNLPPQPADLLQLCLPPFAHRLAKHRELPPSGLPTDVRKPKEIESLRLSLPTPRSICRRKSAKLDQAGLVGMKFQSKLGQPLAKLRKKPLRLDPMLKSHDEVIRPPNNDHVALGRVFPPSLDPQVKYIVKIDIRQQGADAPPLDCTHLTLYSLPSFQHTGFQPLLDETHDASVGNPAPKKGIPAMKHQLAKYAGPLLRIKDLPEFHRERRKQIHRGKNETQLPFSSSFKFND